MKLDLCNYKKHKHISRINIYGNYKMVINSPEVYFGINKATSRNWAQKHNYFWLQKSPRQILQRWKTILIKRFTGTSQDITHNISKN
jgi:hypothetical protein